MTDLDPPKIACEFCGAEFFLNAKGESALHKWHMNVVHPTEEREALLQRKHHTREVPYDVRTQ